MRWLPLFGIALLAQVPVGQPVPTPVGPITTSVIARDQSGRVVTDLTATDVEVWEDGVKQQIATFATVLGGSASPVTGTAGRIFIVLIDDLHLPALDSVRVREILKEIRDRIIRESDLIGIVSTGYSSIAQDLGYDVGHQRFNEAIKKVMGSGGNTAPPDDRRRAHIALATAHELLVKVGQIADRRKSFIYLSNGYDLGPAVPAAYRAEQERYVRDAAFVNPFVRPATDVSAADLAADLAQLVRVARAGNAALYPIDPLGSGADINVSRQAEISQVQVTEGPLQLLADETGGVCMCLSNQFRTFLQRVDDETSDHYVISYASTNRDALKVQRRVEIKNDRPDVYLTYRSDYWLPRAAR